MGADQRELRLPFQKRFILDLAPEFHVLRRTAPVARVLTAAGDPAWLLTAYADVKAMLADPRLGRSHPRPDQAPRLSNSGLLDGPVGQVDQEAEEHGRMRKLMGPVFSPARMALMRARVGQLVDEIIDRLIDRGPPVDLHERLSFALPVLVICELLGVPYEERARFRQWTETAAGMTDMAGAANAFTSLVEYMGELIAHKRARPADDALSDLVALENDWRIGAEELAGLAALLLFAGHETTVPRIDMGVLLLAANPDQQARLVADPSLATTATEEIIRMAGTGGGGGGIPRYAHADIDVRGTVIGTGDAVILSAEAANRDAAVFPDPDRFDITRSPNPHLGFGHGAYFCPGAGLARVELRGVFAAVFRRLRGLRPVVDIAELRLRSDRLTGGLDSLPVTWG
ncbi:cytochrome P450 [Kibdelosporangium aridum]|uniref:Cytochrome P450 n=1 Tax=Kibdelosporangium aridum TaxID=2030 RepID=A0A428Z5B2_KIBAR|nr:cytochrome P450 [Kibdelosporangium aridum]